MLLAGCTYAAFAASPRPNVLLILADDLGYGDVQCYNPERGKIPTPNIDRLARQGMRFTDAHSSGVCSPTRYTLLTGRYHWRSRLQAGIVTYLERPLIAPDRLTVAGLLKRGGYRTAAVGKWHLGWEWNIAPEERDLFAPARNAVPPTTEAHRAAWSRVYRERIAGGPTTRGFDSYFGTDVPNWPPYAFIENDRTVGIPSEFLPAHDFRNNRAGLPGPALPGWELEAVLPAITDRACAILRQAAETPFFLYVALTAPHTPIVPNQTWKGRSGLNAYADFVMATDDAVGRLLAALEASGAADQTLVIFTSDNGCAKLVGLKELNNKGHYPSGPLRGYKSDAFEGGHRVPFIVRWPKVVSPASQCDQLVHLADLFATFADAAGLAVPESAGEDSFSLLPLFRDPLRSARTHAVSNSTGGVPALRSGPWKIIFGPDAGDGVRSPQRRGQLYHLDRDLGETANLWAREHARVASLTRMMEQIVDDGRSTPGARCPNDVPVLWRRFLSEASTPSSPQTPNDEN